VVPGEEPQFNIVTADGKRAVLLNIRSQPDGNTVAIADAVEKEMTRLRNELPPDMRVAVFYDQSLLVRESVGSVWESILFGLLLSIAILFGFLKSGQRWTTTLSTTAIAVVESPRQSGWSSTTPSWLWKASPRTLPPDCHLSKRSAGRPAK
jgi:multidrug efflux pump subunit AcrB